MHNLHKILLGTVLFSVIAPALATESGRPRRVTGMPPSSAAMQVYCPPNGSRCYTVFKSSSSSSVSAKSSSSSSVSTDVSVFVAFLKRYITVPVGWSSIPAENTATFRSPALGSEFTMSLFEYLDCSHDTLEQRMIKAWSAAGKTPPERVGIAKALGAQGLAFSWTEPGIGGRTDRHFCIVPIGHSLTAQVWIDDADLKGKDVIQSKVLAQLWRADRFGRRR